MTLHQELKKTANAAKDAVKQNNAAKAALALLCNPNAEFAALIAGSTCNDEFEVEKAKLVNKKVDKMVKEAQAVVASKGETKLTYDMNAARTELKEMAKSQRNLLYMSCVCIYIYIAVTTANINPHVHRLCGDNRPALWSCLSRLFPFAPILPRKL